MIAKQLDTDDVGWMVNHEPRHRPSLLAKGSREVRAEDENTFRKLSGSPLGSVRKPRTNVTVARFLMMKSRLVQ